MEVHRTIAGLRTALAGERRAGHTVGLAPTMGYLHEGHVSLMRRSVADNGATAATIFVNPLQFGAGEDLSAYPRDLERDAELIRKAGVGHLFVPSAEEMYPGPVLTTITVAGITQTMEGASRPTHFAGVATVVAKLCNIAGPCRAYFGEKDYQQLVVVRRMVTDLSMPVEVVGCSTVRDHDGLALSSRNAYLTAEQRAAAPVLHRALLDSKRAVEGGERRAGAVRARLGATVAREPLAELDYAEVVDATTLDPVDPLAGDLRLLVAARFGRARLLDNVGLLAD